MGRKREREAGPSRVPAPPRRPFAATRPALLVVITLCAGIALVAAAAATRERALAHAAADLRIGLVSALAALLAGGVLLWRQQRAVARPVAALIRAMAEVGANHDYGRSVRASAEGEIAGLIAAFDRLLVAVASRDQHLDGQLAVRTAELAQAQTAAAAARGAEGELLAALRHEIAPPIRAVRGLAEKLASGDAPRHRPFAEIIANAGAGLAARLDELLSASEPRDAGDAPSPGVVDVGAVAEETGALFWDLAAAKGLDLAVYVDPATPRVVHGDSLRLRQVIASLVNNAIEAAETGGVLIEVEPDSPASLRVSIRDTRSPRSGDAGGGPGLAFAERLIGDMGGRLKLSADGGRGSACAFRLPAAPVELPSPWPGPPKTGGTARLLHDGVATRRALGRYLARAGYVIAIDAETPADLVLGAAAALPLQPATVPTVCLGEHGEARPHELLTARAAHAMMVQPFRRSELAILLAQQEAGEPLRETWSEAAPASPGAPAVLMAAPSAKPLPAEVNALLADLERAIDKDALTLAYQPQFDREGREILGVETLVRWNDPARGPVNPALFIPMAEEYGRIDRLTDWVMARALAETADLDWLQVAFNASALEFIDAGIVDRISALLDRTGFDPRRLEVEITETAILENEEQVRENMNALRGMGLKVALDDFGAGYSSLGHLRRYPFDKLKIDREFVIDCTRDVQSATVVHAVVSIGRALGMKVVAEGVETEQQRQFLKIAGVHAMQGFLFGKPMSIEALRATATEVREALRA